MYARLVYAEISLYPDTLKRVQPVLDALRSELSAVKGLETYTLFYDWERGEVGLFAVWHAKEDEQKAWEQIKVKLKSARDIMWKGRPIFKLFNVYEHDSPGGATAGKTANRTTKKKIPPKKT